MVGRHKQPRRDDVRARGLVQSFLLPLPRDTSLDRHRSYLTIPVLHAASESSHQIGGLISSPLVPRSSTLSLAFTGLTPPAHISILPRETNDDAQISQRLRDMLSKIGRQKVMFYIGVDVYCNPQMSLLQSQSACHFTRRPSHLLFPRSLHCKTCTSVCHHCNPQ